MCLLQISAVFELHAGIDYSQPAMHPNAREYNGATILYTANIICSQYRIRLLSAYHRKHSSMCMVHIQYHAIHTVSCNVINVAHKTISPLI